MMLHLRQLLHQKNLLLQLHLLLLICHQVIMVLMSQLINGNYD
jgi:hypothetical protein